jgi:replicative DNA helicase
MEQISGILEDNILTALCWSPEGAPAISLKISPELFSTRHYQRIASAALEHLRRYNCPAKAHLRDYFEKDLRKEQGRIFQETFQFMEELAPHLQVDYVLEELDAWIESRKIFSAIEEADLALRSGNLDKAKEILGSIQRTEDKNEREILFSEPNQVLSFLDRPEAELLSSGIPSLDEKGIRPEKGTLFLFLAPPKQGKSWFLVNAGKHAIVNGHSVLHLTLEISDKDVAKRYVQAFFSMTSYESGPVSVALFDKDERGYISFDRITHDQIVPEILSREMKDKLVKKLALFKKRPPLLIKWFQTGTLTVPQLDGYLEMLKQTRNFEPDMVIIDYPDLMYVGSKNLRVDLGRVFVELRGLAGKRNFALVAATQGNRESSYSSFVRSYHVAEDFSKVATADVVITYSQTEAELKKGLARIYVDAARNAMQDLTVLISQSYSIGQFCLDSGILGEWNLKNLEEDHADLTRGD